ncbi:MAG: MATE family efflux transporter [Deltaproteobacteria bacterium]|nr:MAG: MATE family efflux transporter [Deltaproteobacteria bacterium]
MANPVSITTQLGTSVSRGGVREVGILAFPVVLTQMSTTAMMIVDSAMVGRLGATQLAAVGLGGIWLWTAVVVFVGAASGVQIFVSQAHGAGNARDCGPWVWYALASLLPLSVVGAGTLALLVEPFLRLLGPSAELQSVAASYMLPRLPGSVGVTVTMILASFFRGLGNTRTPLYATLVAVGVNAVLDYGLIFGRLGLPEWGVAGAGAATAIGEWVNAGILFAVFSRHGMSARFGTAPRWPIARQVRRFLRTGAPVGGQWVLDMLSFAAFTTLIARMGDASMAASQAFIMLLSISFMQAFGISIASSTLVGRYIGADDLAAARRSFWSGLKLVLLVGGAIAALFIGFPDALLRVFTDDPAVLRFGAPLVVLGALFQLLDAVGIIAGGALRGAGDTRWPFWVHTALAWLVFVPLAYLLGVKLGGGLTAAWAGATFYVAALAGALVWRFVSGAWQEIHI